LPAVFYGHETWALSIKDADGVPRGISGRKTEGKWQEDNQTKDEIGRTCGTHGKEEKCIQKIYGENDENRQAGTTREYYGIAMNHKDIDGGA
jgi:hypothetical protein